VTSLEVANVVRARFERYIQVPFDIFVAYDNAPVDENQLDGKLWARCTMVDGDGEQLTLGKTKRFRTYGALVVQVFGPIGSGDAGIREVVDEIDQGVDENNICLFRSVKADGLTWRTPSITNVGASGKWWQINVTCPFYYEASLNTF
jgi:hypothetical protein